MKHGHKGQNRGSKTSDAVSSPDRSSIAAETVSTAAAATSKGGPRATKAALLEAAREIFAQHGFEGATFSMIAEKAGVNTSQINYHFQDKVHLYRAILSLSNDDQRIETLLNLIKGAASETEFRLRLEVFAVELLAWYARDEFGIRIVMCELVRGLPFGPDIVEARFERMWGALIDFIEQARKDGVIRSDVDSRIVALSILGVFHALGTARPLTEKFIGVALEDDEQRTQLAKKLIGNLVTGLGNGGSGGLNEKPA